MRLGLTKSFARAQSGLPIVNILMCNLNNSDFVNHNRCANTLNLTSQQIFLKYRFGWKLSRQMYCKKFSEKIIIIISI